MANELYAFGDYLPQFQRYESDDNTADNIETGVQPFSVPEQSAGFVFERGECRVGAQKADDEEQAPLGIFNYPLGHEGHQKADQKTAGDIDDEGAEGETPSPALADPESDPVSRYSADETADSYDEDIRHRCSL